MFTIAIIEDDWSQMDQFSKYIRKVEGMQGHLYHILQFHSLNQFQDRFLKEDFQILLLNLKQVSEKKVIFDLTRKLHGILPEVYIILLAEDAFLTELAWPGYIYTVSKSKADEQLSAVLDDICTLLYPSAPYGVPILHNRRTLILPLHEIVYLEKSLRKICFNCKSPEKYLDRAEVIKRESENRKLTVDTYGSFEDYRSHLTKHFCQTHRSYIVNLNYVRSLQGNSLILFSGEIIPISRNFKNAVSRQIEHVFF